MFHDSVPQRLSFDEARFYCGATGAELATTAQLYLAWSEGLDHCSPGWLADGSVRYPIVTPRERCGGPQAGVKTLYRFRNQTGFPEPFRLHDVYCFKGGSLVPQLQTVYTYNAVSLKRYNCYSVFHRKKENLWGLSDGQCAHRSRRH